MPGNNYTVPKAVPTSHRSSDHLSAFVYLSTSFVWICVHGQQGCQPRTGLRNLFCGYKSFKKSLEIADDLIISGK